MLKKWDNYFNSKTRKSKGGKVETQVSSTIVNTDNKDHEIVAEYQIFERGGKGRLQNLFELRVKL